MSEGRLLHLEHIAWAFLAGTLVSATMSPPDGISVTQLQQALAKGQLQALLPSALDAAPGVESFKTGQGARAGRSGEAAVDVPSHTLW